MGGGLEEQRGLAADHLHVLTFADLAVAHIGQLHHFAFGDRVGGVGENGHDLHLPQLDHELKGPRVEEITDQNTGRVAPRRVGGRPAPSQQRVIHHVVVQQRGGMQELDDGGELDVIRAVVAAAVGGQEHEQRPQPLAAGLHDVLADLFDHGDVRGEPGWDQPIGGGEIVRYQVIHGSQGGQRGFARRFPGCNCGVG